MCAGVYACDRTHQIEKTGLPYTFFKNEIFYLKNQQSLKEEKKSF